MIYIFLLTLFVFGLVFGSFLNAFEYRLFTNQDWVKSRSHCPNCKHDLGIFDLVPVISWIFLGGGCRYCKKQISVQYPTVEFFMGALFAGYGWVSFGSEFTRAFITESNFLMFVFGLVVIWLLVFFTIYDLKYGLIPDNVLFPLIGITLFRNIIFLFCHGQTCLSTMGFLNHLLTAFIAGGFFFLVIFFTKGKGMGGGDMKFAFWIGLFFGAFSTLVTLYIAFVIGGIYGAMVLTLGKKKFGQTLPFGPFLCLGSIVVLFFGEQIIESLERNFFFGLF